MGEDKSNGDAHDDNEVADAESNAKDAILGAARSNPGEKYCEKQ